MITLFEVLTRELTTHEKRVLVPMLKSTLYVTHEKNKFTADNLVKWFKASREHTSPVRIRKMIQYLRATNAYPGKMVIGGGRGYYLTKEVVKMDGQIKSLKDRISAQQFTLKKLVRQRNLVKKRA